MSVDALKIKSLLLASANNILAEVNSLTELDSALGDGDHGTTMEKVVHVIIEKVGSWNADTDVKASLEELNEALDDVSGGSAAPLVSSFVCGMANEANNDDDTDTFIKNILLGAYEEFFDMSGAAPGGKTMMDAIYPATEVIREADTISLDVLQAAAVAARKGSDSTADMLAKFGRARYFGDKAIGHKDPGSVTFALLYEGLAKGYEA